MIVPSRAGGRAWEWVRLGTTWAFPLLASDSSRAMTDSLCVAAYHHRSITVVSQWYSSGAVPSAPARQNLFKYKNNSAVKISLSIKNIAVMQW